MLNLRASNAKHHEYGMQGLLYFSVLHSRAQNTETELILFAYILFGELLSHFHELFGFLKHNTYNIWTFGLQRVSSRYINRPAHLDEVPW